MITQIRSRKNSRTVTQSLLNMSQQPNNISTSVLPVDQEIPKSYTETIMSKNETQSHDLFNTTLPSFKTFLFSHKNTPKQHKSKHFIDQFLQRRQLSITKVSVRFGRFHMAMNETPQGYKNQTCFLSKKLKQKQNSIKTQKKLDVKKINSQNLRYSLDNQKQNNCRIYFSQQQEKSKQLKSINLLKRKYTFFNKVNKTVV